MHVSKIRLHPYIRTKVVQLGILARQAGVSFHLTSAFRSFAKQAALKTKLPKAAPGCSQHQYGLAFDAVSNDQELLGKLGQQAGLWWSFTDPVHFAAFDPKSWRWRLCRFSEKKYGLSRLKERLAFERRCGLNCVVQMEVIPGHGGSYQSPFEPLPSGAVVVSRAIVSRETPVGPPIVHPRAERLRLESEFLGCFPAGTPGILSDADLSAQVSSCRSLRLRSLPRA